MGGRRDAPDHHPAAARPLRGDILLPLPPETGGAKRIQSGVKMSIASTVARGNRTI